ncbi:hypothetical protein GCU56_22905, partial [Geodermatophilus sabuli]
MDAGRVETTAAGTAGRSSWAARLLLVTGLLAAVYGLLLVLSPGARADERGPGPDPLEAVTQVLGPVADRAVRVEVPSPRDDHVDVAEPTAASEAAEPVTAVVEPVMEAPSQFVVEPPVPPAARPTTDTERPGPPALPPVARPTTDT